MAVSENGNRPVKSDSNTKPAKKKKAAKTLATENSSTVSTPLETSHSNGVSHSINGDGPHENPYIRDLQKSIRNINKKITNASKVDNVIAENPDKTLDELVAARKINADQKAQILKKPTLQASLVQLEDQVAQYIKLDAEIKIKYQNEKVALEKNLQEKFRKDLEEGVALAKAEAHEIARKELQENLLLLSQFLKLAAIRRAEEESAELEESKALEGLLAQVYSGDANAVAAMLNLIHGSGETLKSVTGEDLNVTYATLKAASMAQVPYIENDDQVSESEFVAKDDQLALSDASAAADTSFTEIDAAVKKPQENGHPESYQSQVITQDIDISNNCANTGAGANWDTGNEISHTQEWADNHHNTQSETELSFKTGTIQTQSWADDQPVITTETASIPTNSISDGFQEIQRNRGGRGNRGGRYDGHRGRGHYRGDGYRGRGRGSNRGNRRSGD